jgi:hypothetical protein
MLVEQALMHQMLVDQCLMVQMELERMVLEKMIQAIQNIENIQLKQQQMK